MKETLKVGDRVACYGKPLSPDNLMLFEPGERGIVADVEIFNGLIQVNIDGDEDLAAIFHPKQCRRLIKKKRREIWVNEFSDKFGTLCWSNEDEAKKNGGEKCLRQVRFVEARPKKDGEK